MCVDCTGKGPWWGLLLSYCWHCCHSCSALWTANNLIRYNFPSGTIDSTTVIDQQSTLPPQFCISGLCSSDSLIPHRKDARPFQAWIAHLTSMTWHCKLWSPLLVLYEVSIQHHHQQYIAALFRTVLCCTASCGISTVHCTCHSLSFGGSTFFPAGVHVLLLVSHHKDPIQKVLSIQFLMRLFYL